MSDSTIEGIDELIAKFKQLEAVPQSMVTSAAKKGATMALKFAQANLQPVNGEFLSRQGKKEQHQGGDLKNALKLKREKNPKGKCVYKIDTTWYAKFKDLGFTTRNGKKIEGSHFLKYALTEHYAEIREAIIAELSKGIDKVVGPD
ncbi:MAG: HK97-gp10 family putative phage morphogenesis protein [Desulfitobacteriaceae bacterium]